MRKNLLGLIVLSVFGFQAANAGMTKKQEGRPCANIFEVVQQFRFLITVGGAQLSANQQILASKFIEVLDQEITPPISCVETPSKKALTVESSEGLIITGVMKLDNLGEISDLHFDSFN